jgi:hypothetical protein
MQGRRILVCALAGALASMALLAVPGVAGAKTQQRPTAVTAVSAISADTALVVSWSPPANPGTSPVTGYVTSVTHHKTCVATGPTSCLVAGLSNGYPYTVHVRAVNATGAGKPIHVSGIPGTAQNCGYVGPYANLEACGLAWTNLSGDDLTGADLTDAVLEGTNLSHTDLQGARLTGADLQYVGNGGITGVPASLPSGWGLAGGYLFGPGVGVDWTDLTGVATFPVADLTGANFEGSNLSGDDLSAVVSLEDVNAEYTDLAGADLAGENLTGSDLTGADLAGATVTGADVTGVVWSNTTCPDGSNSDGNGGTCVGYGF